MGSNLVFLVISLLVSCATWYLYAILRASGLRDSRMKGFSALCICLPFWTILNVIATLVRPELFHAVYILKTIPLDMMPYISCWFILNFSESKAANSRVIRYFSIIMPVLSIGMELTNPLHGLYLLAFTDPPVPGPLFLAHLAVSMSYMLIVYIILFRYVVKNYRNNPMLIIGGIGTVIPIAVYIFYLFFPSVLPYDITPIGYFFTIVFVAYASYSSRLRNVKPGILGETLAKIANSEELSTGTINDTAALIVKEGCYALDTYRFGIWLYDDKTKILKNVASFNSNINKYTVQNNMDLNNLPQEVMQIFESDRAVLISDRKELDLLDNIVGDFTPEVCSLIGASIRIGGKLMGIVSAEQNYCLAFPIRREWSTEEQSFVSSLADFMALAITNSERQSLIRRLEKERLILFDILPVGIIILGKNDGAFLYANNTARNIYGASSAGAGGAIRNVLNFMPEFQPDGRRSSDVLKELSRMEKGVVETLNLKMSGETFWSRTSFCAINYNGIDATINVIEDMTADHEHQTRLHEIVLKEQEANQLKSRFLARMSHEIRTPMNAIIGMTELALRETETNAKNEHINTVKHAGLNLLAIINDILDFSKIEAGKMEIRPEEYSVASLLNDVVSIIRISAANSHLHFAVKADSKIPHTLIGDETRIRQVFLNILNNAVKYTEHGFVLLNINCNFTGEDTMDLIFEVTDSGIGIEQEDIDKLFTDFTQLDLDRRSIEGIGLGLAITHSIVSAMDGTISVKSEKGKGSTFSITIPQKYPLREGIAAVTHPGDKSILIFEKIDVYADSLSYAMDNLGTAYKLVKNGTDLYKEMEKRVYDYLFISLPLYNKNEDTMQKLGKDTKIIIMAEYGETAPEKNLSTLYMPIYCTGIADALNTVYGEQFQSPNGESFKRFTAPDAKVLIVDDIYTNLKVAEGLMKPYNMQVDLCSSGKASIEAVKENRYDIVFMDHKMPGMDGIEATKQIREWEKTLPIIALTANAVSGMREMFIENGFNDFISKPIDTFKLNAILEKWIPKEKREAVK